MAQLAFRLLLERSNFLIDFLICWVGVFIHSFLEYGTLIDFNTKKYDLIFFLTVILISTRIIITVTTFRKKKIEEVRRIKLENDKIELENERQKKDLL